MALYFELPVCGLVIGTMGMELQMVGPICFIHLEMQTEYIGCLHTMMQVVLTGLQVITFQQ
jgi:hypothetical protein